MRYDGWKETRLIDVIDINPRTPLRKGTLAKKVSMQDVAEFTRKIQSYEIAEFTSGSKFKNGDTLLARITPCLENGKTAYVDILEDNEIAFGSTEFIVLRAKEGITDSKFVYYLAISPEFRNIAIKSMTGSSGRQRVQSDVLVNTVIDLPPLEEQKRIANVLSAIDDKIELNNEINQTLEELAQTIFKRWFVDFEFPNENGEPYKSSGGKFVQSELGMIPEGWRSGTLGELIKISSGKRPLKKSKEKTEEFLIPLIGASSVMGYVKEVLYDEKILIIGRVGTHGVVQRYQKKCWPSDNTLVIKSSYYEYIYQLLKSIDYAQLNRGSTQPLITQTDVKNVKIIIPSKEVLEKYELLVGTLFNKAEKSLEENVSLSALRDTLLPKLMSGEIRVVDAEREVEVCLQKSS
ncbi:MULTISPECIES: restriction endonuclease subunit S [Geobacillus]|uniref:Restriction endonuclease subunit S n=1 Tax=Geobacillus proteiniphilus TaxID=860353 RepID=A0ABY9MH53_9BACL|nr:MULTISPECIES: restriction endonuclease subunit S [Geobacillus]MED0654904.1 restriction endonuclease subunit S [Anoxybacillus geothermalis]KFL16567.1 restriction endonuclease subunit S [Geobacillus stearothermophilus]KFX35835.1 restriction endonuclease subunit S [Geobacillus stearothermophilus]MDF9295619.1 restriction endonuclease subunit S [Geobacillus stearothermophilus]WMJ17271.1 restriction endonuclease subunit S [Geobacillus proteiniphilus]